jgi:hypothetical protein
MPCIAYLKVDDDDDYELFTNETQIKICVSYFLNFYIICHIIR